MNLGQLKTRVASDIADPNHVVVAETDLTDWTNEAIRKIARQTAEHEFETTIAIVAGTQDYALPAGAIYISRIENEHSVKLEQVELESFEKMGYDGTDLGAPVFWWEHDEAVHFYPIPNENETYKLWYAGLPTALVDTTDDATELPLPLSYHDTIVTFVRMRANERIGDLNSAVFSQGELEKMLMEDRQEANHPERDEFPAISGSSYDAVWD